MATLIEHFKELLAYETWANDRVLASLESIPPERRAGPAYDRVMGLLPHNLMARRLWLLRINAAPYEPPRDWFPVMTVAATRALAAEVDGQWSGYLAALSQPELEREMTYTSSEGVCYTNRVREVLTHVFNHSTYHRGQIARIVAELGGQRAGTDAIAMTRVRIDR